MAIISWPMLRDAEATACLVSRPQDALATAQIVVDDTLVGLTRLGMAGRNRFSGKMVGITGSVGKMAAKICWHIF